MTASKTTIDHDEIRRWVEARGGHPARVKTKGDGGLLRIDFGTPEESLEEISWDQFFSIFDRNELAFLYQEQTAASDESRFNKFISRS